MGQIANEAALKLVYKLKEKIKEKKELKRDQTETKKK